MSVTAHKGIDSKNPQSSTAVTISDGRIIVCAEPKPAADMMVDTNPWAMEKSAFISSRPWVTAAEAQEYGMIDRVLTRKI